MRNVIKSDHVNDFDKYLMYLPFFVKAMLNANICYLVICLILERRCQVQRFAVNNLPHFWKGDLQNQKILKLISKSVDLPRNPGFTSKPGVILQKYKGLPGNLDTRLEMYRFSLKYWCLLRNPEVCIEI